MMRLTMSASAVYWVVATCVLVITLSPRHVHSQIPEVCANARSLQSMECCPSNCSRASGRGMCVDVEPLPDMMSDDVRSNWPHYFQRICQCHDNYAGYDCSRCKYGYYGPDCGMKQVLPRRNILKLSVQDFTEYIEILQMTRSYNSGYVAVLDQFRPGSTSIETVPVTLYQIFIWLHHFAAKDSECEDDCIKVDYAHESTGFPTWHRQYLLWFEWEVQYMLKSMNRPNYHTFRINYWDWRDQNRAELLTADKLGANVNGQSELQGVLFDAGWDTICWYNGSGGVMTMRGTICDPRVNTGCIQRCPIIDGINPCKSPNNWPTSDNVEDALTKAFYDTETFNPEATETSFRNLMEGFEVVEDCGNNQLCIRNNQRHLHNTVHIITGIGHFYHNLSSDQKGVMADTAASPNDPVFINHHGMIDCILEEWLQRNPNGRYPDVPEEIKGHQREGYIVPFFPLYKHSDMFMTADNFGYTCDIEFQQRGGAIPALSRPVQWIALIAVCSLALLM